MKQETLITGGIEMLKRLGLGLVASLVLLLGMLGGVLADPPLWGDANLDGQVNMADVTRIEQIILSLNPPTLEADSNQDGKINMADVTCTEYRILGIWSSK